MAHCLIIPRFNKTVSKTISPFFINASFGNCFFIDFLLLP